MTDNMIRWKLELSGTSQVQLRELENAVDEIGWHRFPSRTEQQLGVTRVYIATDDDETAHGIAQQLAEHIHNHLPNIARQQKPITRKELLARLERARELRAQRSHQRIAVRP